MLSSFMEGRDFLLNPDVDQLEELVSPKWTIVPSILYALSILVYVQNFTSCFILLALKTAFTVCNQSYD